MSVKASRRMLITGMALLAISAGTTCLFSLWRAAAIPDGKLASLIHDTDDNPSEDIDWATLRSAYPHLAGWMRIPDTNIDYPIVQSPEEDPSFYLSHDACDDENPYGAIFILGEDRIPVNPLALSTIFGHNMSDGTMFSELEHYSDQVWCREHQVISLYTQQGCQELSVAFVSIINADNQLLPTLFSTQEAYQSWIQQQLNDAKVVLDPAPNTPLYAFCTCSYGYYASQRTIVFASGRAT